MSPMSEAVRVGVVFPPATVKINSMPERPRAGKNVTLVCETGSSNPASDVSWWHNGERLAGTTEVVNESRFGGWVTTSELVLAATAQHHGAVVTCEAANEAVDKRVHDAVTLGVNRKFNNIFSNCLFQNSGNKTDDKKYVVLPKLFSKSFQPPGDDPLDSEQLLRLLWLGHHDFAK
jgi:hypothetical protein